MPAGVEVPPVSVAADARAQHDRRRLGAEPAVRDGKYRTDFVGPRCDCVELMSWWEWSPLGPQGIPLDQVSEKLGEAKYEMWKSYFVARPGHRPDDVHQQPRRLRRLQPALGRPAGVSRRPSRRIGRRGALVTLYTDPFRVDHNTKCGRQ